MMNMIHIMRRFICQIYFIEINMEETSHKDVPKPKQKKKPSKPRAKKSDKVKDMFAGMTEKEKRKC